MAWIYWALRWPHPRMAWTFDGELE